MAQKNVYRFHEELKLFGIKIWEVDQNSTDYAYEVPNNEIIDMEILNDRISNLNK